MGVFNEGSDEGIGLYYRNSNFDIRIDIVDFLESFAHHGIVGIFSLKEK
jgi:hypothetical protein